MTLSGRDSRMTAVPSLSFDMDYILFAEEDFQNMDSFAEADSSADIDSSDSRVLNKVHPAAVNNWVDKVHNSAVSSPASDSSPTDPYSEAVNGDMGMAEIASVSNKVKNSYLAPLHLVVTIHYVST